METCALNASPCDERGWERTVSREICQKFFPSSFVCSSFARESQRRAGWISRRGRRISRGGALAAGIPSPTGSRARTRTSSVFWSATTASSSNALVSAERLEPESALCGMLTGGLDMVFVPRVLTGSLWRAVRRSRRGDGGARRGLARAVSASRGRWTGTPDGRAFARVRGASSRAPELEPGRPRRAPCAKALAFRMDGVRGRRTSGERLLASRRRALGFDRAAHARVRVSFGSAPAHRGGDGEASPGAWFREDDARRVLCGKHTGGGATVADVTRVPVVFAVRVSEDYEPCRVSRVSRRRVFFLSRDSRATASVGLESRSVERESGRGR